jgi:hypothetical protein
MNVWQASMLCFQGGEYELAPAGTMVRRRWWRRRRWRWRKG